MCVEAEPAPHDSPPLGQRALQAVPFSAATIAFVVYAGTAARTITWWDGSSYPLAAVTLGIPGAPGSLLLVLLGWLLSRFPIVHPIAFQLNLFAAVLVATLVGLVSWLGARLATPEGREPGAAEHLAGGFAGLTLAFAVTPWTYAIQLTPYSLSALWTALILVVALAWWRRPETSDGAAWPANVPWLWPFARLDGLAFRIIPSDDPAVHDVEHLRRQLLERVSYAGVADTTVTMDRDSRTMCSSYLYALVQLAFAEKQAGRTDEALATLRCIEGHMPLARLSWGESQLDAVRAQIKSEPARGGPGLER